MFLMVVHDNHLLPVICDFFESEAAADINEVEDVLLEARATKSHRRFQEFRSDAAVRADGAGHFIHICAGFFAQGAHGVDRADALRQESIGSKLG